MLVERGVKRLLVEGGSKVVTSFLRSQRVDHLSIEIAMRLLGALGVGAIEVARSLANVSIERLGENVIVRGDVVYA